MFCQFLFIVACTGFTCPNGSRCRVCEKTGLAYCDFSCSIKNGGCPKGEPCGETPVSCPPGQCCSSVNITCQRKFSYIDY